MTCKSIWRSVSLISLVACGAGLPRDGGPADLVMLGGDVRTMDPAHPHARALAVRAGTIVAVGDDDVARAWIGPATRVVLLRGHTVTPGLVDAHCHLYGLGVDRSIVSVRGAASEAAAARAVADAAAGQPAGEWVIGRGWDQNRWPGHAFPSHASLDAAGGDHPVLLRRVDGHATWVNSRALAIAGIDRQTVDPAGGKIVRDERGEPTGVLVDNAMALVDARLPPASAELRARRLRTAAALAVAAGLTGVHEMGIDAATVDAYRALAEHHELPLRVTAYATGDPDHLDALATPPPPPLGRFQLRGVKFFADGALGSRGARLAADYDDEPGNRGLWVTEPAALARAVDAAVAGGWQVATHAIGDAAIASVLDAYLAAGRAHPGDHRLRVEHLQIVAAADLARLTDAGAIASMQPTHATSDMPWAEARVGAARIRGGYAWRTVLEHHVPLAFGSDFPVEDVSALAGIYAAVTRQDADGAPASGWYPEQRVTLDEAIAAFTRGAAYAEFAEATRGTIARGRVADLTVFDRALAPDRSLLATRVAMTIVGGEVVYAGDRNSGGPEVERSR